MTVSTEVDHNDYTGNGVTTSFPYTFRIFTKTDLMVQVVDLNENITVLALDTDYSVTGAGAYSGGSVVLSSPLANGWQISISRELPATQETDLRNQGKFYAEVHEDAFDKLTMMIQQVRTWFNLSLRKPTFIANYYDALNNRIRNLRDPSQAQDAATKNYVDSQIVDNTNAWQEGDRVLDQKIDANFRRTLRVPESNVEEIFPVSGRRNSLFGWNSSGRPVPIFSMTDTADLALKLASNEDGLGDSLVGHRRRTVRERLDDEVSVLDFGPANQFGTAMMAAMDYVMSQGGGTIFVPGRSYTLDTTIVKTLTADIHIRMSKGADVAVKSPMDVYNLDAGDFQFFLDSGKTTVSLSALGVGLAVFRITGRTLQQTCRIEGHTLRKTGSNNIGYFVYAVGANAPEFMHNHISAASIVYHLESSTENSSSGLIANAMEAEISSNKVYNCSVAVEIVNKGYYGCEGVIIAFNKFVCGDTAIRVIADASLRSAYMPPLIQVISNHLNAYKAISAQKISRLFFSKNDIQSKFRADDTVSGMIELYSCQGWSIVDNEFAAVSQDGSGRSNTNSPIFLGELDSVLPNAYGTIGGNTFWLDGMTAKAIDMSSTAAYTGQRIKYGLNTLQSLSAITSRAYGSKLKISEENSLSTYDVSEGLAYSSADANYAFDSALGILYIKGAAPARDLHIISTNVVPNGATINKMVAENTFGKQLVIQFSAAEITFTHGVNLIAPDQKTTKLWLPAFVITEFFNNQQCRIVSVSGVASRHVVPVNPGSGAPGSVGDEYYNASSGEWKRYFPGTGWRVISTSANN